jgi:hypothetical protein
METDDYKFNSFYLSQKYETIIQILEDKKVALSYLGDAKLKNLCECVLKSKNPFQQDQTIRHEYDSHMDKKYSGKLWKTKF